MVWVLAGWKLTCWGQWGQGEDVWGMWTWDRVRVQWEQGEDLGVENQHRYWVLEAKKESKGDLHGMSRWGLKVGVWMGRSVVWPC